MNQYEMMILFDPGFATDFQQAKTEVERILSRSEAEVVFLEKWDERRLAYEIKGCKRGCYVLSYFNCAPDKLVGIERDASLSDPILRYLIKQANGITRDHMESFLSSRREEAGPVRVDQGDKSPPPATETKSADAQIESAEDKTQSAATKTDQPSVESNATESSETESSPVSTVTAETKDSADA